MSATDYHLFREDRATRWRRIAAHLAAHPEDLHIALDNITRWLKLGRVHPAPLLEWRSKIEQAQANPAAFTELIAFLAAENHDDGPLKSCSPFAGIADHPSPETLTS